MIKLEAVSLTSDPFSGQEWERAGIARLSKTGRALMIYTDRDTVCINIKSLQALLFRGYTSAPVTRPPIRDIRGDNL